MPKDPPTKPETPKRATPQASPEFAAARLARDLRLLDARRANLDTTYRTRHMALSAELKNVEAIYEEKIVELSKKREALALEFAKHRAALESVLSAAEVKP